MLNLGIGYLLKVRDSITRSCGKTGYVKSEINDLGEEAYIHYSTLCVNSWVYVEPKPMDWDSLRKVGSFSLFFLFSSQNLIYVTKHNNKQINF